jgi:hypothetical protein
MSKLTPEQACEIGQKFFGGKCSVHNWPGKGNVICCSRLGGDGYVAFFPEIDWPEGMTRYPPPEPKYREPTQKDVGKMVEVRDFDRDDWCPVRAKLLAVIDAGVVFRFIVSFDAMSRDWTKWRQARIAVDEPSLMDGLVGAWIPNKDGEFRQIYPKPDLPHPDAKPIETAPKDRLIWLLMGGEWVTGFFDGNIWLTGIQPNGVSHSLKWDDENQPTHWREIK